jgi:hypothetical protein
LQNCEPIGQRLTLLAPAIIDSVLDVHQPEPMTLALLMRPFTVVWHRQVAMGFGPGALRSE